MNQRFVSLVWSVILLGLHQAGQAATATCHCQLGIEPGPGALQMLDTPGIDMTGWANLSFTGVFVFTPANQGDCKNRCEAVLNQNIGAIADSVCAHYKSIGQGAPQQHINLYRWLGAEKPWFVKDVGRLWYRPAVHRYICPPTWAANETNVVGGVTEQGVCKKEGGPLGINPPPPNGTQIGSWGFVWGGSAIAYGTTANGGAPTDNLVSAQECHFY